MSTRYGSSARERQILQSGYPVVQRVIRPPTLQQVIYPPYQVLYPRMIIPSYSPVNQQIYNPPCSQYLNFAPGSIISRGDVLYGNCSPNTNNDPFAAPYDFQCRSGICVSSTGASGNSPDAICCPQFNATFNPAFWPVPIVPRPHDWDRNDCCNAIDVNSCALCLDRRQGVTDSASHFQNMTRCKSQCGY